MAVNRLISLVIALTFSQAAIAQSLYFPPLVGDQWDTLSPESLGWCAQRIEAMYNMLEENDTKAFIILKDGKIVLEKYFDSFQQDSVWYWASAGKSLTACLVGIAQQEGLLSISDTTRNYLGQGWTSCTPEDEAMITIRHQLTMSTGLDDKVPDNYCTLDTCLQYKADAGTRWAYHNAPYTLLDDVMVSATGQSLNAFFQQHIRLTTGINGIFLPSGYNNVFYSKPRSMARFGLMILNHGNWDGNQVISDTAYFNRMLNSSQALNLSYGYLWWLNGKASYMLPSLQFVFPGSLIPNAPDDMVAALGKNGQFVNVIPSMNMVLIRMGNAPDGNPVPVTLNDKIWEHINGLDCSTAIEQDQPLSSALFVYPNPAINLLHIRIPGKSFDVYLFDMLGNEVLRKYDCLGEVQVNVDLPQGLYEVRAQTAVDQWHYAKLMLVR